MVLTAGGTSASWSSFRIEQSRSRSNPSMSTTNDNPMSIIKEKLIPISAHQDAMLIAKNLFAWLRLSSANVLELRMIQPDKILMTQMVDQEKVAIIDTPATK